MVQQHSPPVIIFYFNIGFHYHVWAPSLLHMFHENPQLWLFRLQLSTVIPHILYVVIQTYCFLRFCGWLPFLPRSLQWEGKLILGGLLRDSFALDCSISPSEISFIDCCLLETSFGASFEDICFDRLLISGLGLSVPCPLASCSWAEQKKKKLGPYGVAVNFYEVPLQTGSPLRSGCFFRRL